MHTNWLWSLIKLRGLHYFVQHDLYARIWSHYGHIMLHNTVTNPRGHTQYHNQIIHNSSSIHQFKHAPQPIALIRTIYTIHLLTLIGAGLYTNNHSHRSTQLPRIMDGCWIKEYVNDSMQRRNNYYSMSWLLMKQHSKSKFQTTSAGYFVWICYFFRSTAWMNKQEEGNMMRIELKLNKYHQFHGVRWIISMIYKLIQTDRKDNNITSCFIYKNLLHGLWVIESVMVITLDDSVIHNIL